MIPNYGCVTSTGFRQRSMSDPEPFVLYSLGRIRHGHRHRLHRLRRLLVMLSSHRLVVSSSRRLMVLSSCSLFSSLRLFLSPCLRFFVSSSLPFVTSSSSTACSSSSFSSYSSSSSSSPLSLSFLRCRHVFVVVTSSSSSSSSFLSCRRFFLVAVFVFIVVVFIVVVSVVVMFVVVVVVVVVTIAKLLFFVVICFGIHLVWLNWRVLMLSMLHFDCLLVVLLSLSCLIPILLLFVVLLLPLWLFFICYCVWLVRPISIAILQFSLRWGCHMADDYLALSTCLVWVGSFSLGEVKVRPTTSSKELFTPQFIFLFSFILYCVLQFLFKMWAQVGS